MEQLLPFTDPDAVDPFDPSQFSEAEGTLKGVHLKAGYTAVLSEYLLAQIDIFQFLLQAGCSLSIFDKIINWVLHYCCKSSEDMWLKQPFKSQKKFIGTIFTI